MGEVVDDFTSLLVVFLVESETIRSRKHFCLMCLSLHFNNQSSVVATVTVTAISQSTLAVVGVRGVAIQLLYFSLKTQW